MKLAVAGDVVGKSLAQALQAHFKASGLDVTDLSEPPRGGAELYAYLSDRVCARIMDGTYERAILVCGTGIGVCIAANKMPGIRAALTHDTYSAQKAATSNNAQVITMGARVIGQELAKAIADAWLASDFDPHGRSAGNVRAINQVDGKYNIGR